MFVSQFLEVGCWNFFARNLAIPPPESVEAARSRTEVILNLVRLDKPTLRQLLGYLKGARGHYVTAGTPEQIADLIEDWFTEGAADGFSIMPPLLPAQRDVFSTEVIPILQRRGLFRTEREDAARALPSAVGGECIRGSRLESRAARIRCRCLNTKFSRAKPCAAAGRTRNNDSMISRLIQRKCRRRTWVGMPFHPGSACLI